MTKRRRHLYDISNESLFYFLSIQVFHFVKILKEKKSKIKRLFLLNILSVNITRLILYLYE